MLGAWGMFGIMSIKNCNSTIKETMQDIRENKYILFFICILFKFLIGCSGSGVNMLNDFSGEPNVLKCEGDCGVIDIDNNYSAVARLCYKDDNQNTIGSDVTFIEEDIILSQAHILGFEETLPCCGIECSRSIDSDYKRFKDKLYVCDGRNYANDKKIIGKIINVSVRSNGPPPGYDLLLAHIDRNCSQCNKDVQIKPIPTAKNFPNLNQNAIHVYVGDPKQNHKRRYDKHILNIPITGSKTLPCTRQTVKHDGVENPPMIFETSGSPVFIEECNKKTLHGLHGNGNDYNGVMFEHLQLVQTQREWILNNVIKWTGRDKLIDACSPDGLVSLREIENSKIIQLDCNDNNLIEEPFKVCKKQNNHKEYIFENELSQILGIED